MIQFGTFLNCNERVSKVIYDDDLISIDLSISICQKWLIIWIYIYYVGWFLFTSHDECFQIQLNYRYLIHLF